MPTTNLKVQLEFRMGPDGWSEIYYHSGSSPKGFEATARLLVTERLKILVSVASIHHVRIAPAQPGARSYRFPIQNGAGGKALLRDVGAVTSTVGCYTDSGVFRKLKFHGVEDEQHRFDASGNPGVGLAADIRTFVQYLVTNSYQIKHISVPVSDAGNLVVSNITVAGGVVTFVCNATTLTAGQHVKVNGCVGYKAGQFNGTWRIGTVLTPPTNGFTSVSRRLIDPSFQYVLSSGRIRNAESDGYTFLPITSFDDFEYPGTRKTGRPTDEHRGRVSTRR